VKENLDLRSKRARAQALLQGSRLVEARALYQEICDADHLDAEAWLKLGVIAGRLGDAAKALEALQCAARLRPAHIPTLFNLGIALRDSGCVEDAVSLFNHITEVEPQHWRAQYMLARGLDALGRTEQAVERYRALHALRPEDPSVLASLGIGLHSLGRLQEAVTCYRKALAVGGQDGNTRDNLAAALCQQGRSEEAITVYRRTLQLQAQNPRALSNLLLALHYTPAEDDVRLFEEHKRWGELYGSVPFDAVVGFANPPDPERRLRVGYVSPDLCEHSVSYFFEPILLNHNRDSIEVTCYSASSQSDATTARLRSLADRWRDIAGLDDRRVVDMVRRDEIDVLVDLAGHTGENRLPVFAHRPAPVQVTYLGYPDTTGLPAIGYRLCDGVTDPEEAPTYCTEELVRLPGCFLCYRPPVAAPRVADPPVARHGYVTFGSFNNLAKISDDVVATWAALLLSVPDARLVLKSAFLADAKTGERYLDLFAERGIHCDRIELFGRAPTIREHLAMYEHVDVALDTFPYNGTTTTCESLWMGVPVITLAGQRHAGRVGKSLLTAVGLETFAVDTWQEYIRTAVRLATAHAELATLRRTLRERVETSVLCDGSRFAGLVEGAYRAMWCRWCREPQA
jgi:protein O-GlcNAc transferase